MNHLNLDSNKFMIDMISNYKERKEWKKELTERERLQRYWYLKIKKISKKEEKTKHG